MLWNRFGDRKDIWDTKDAMDFEGFLFALRETISARELCFWPAPFVVVCFIPPKATPMSFCIFDSSFLTTT